MATATRNFKASNGYGLARMPPQDVDVEQAALGAMMINNRAISEVMDWLKPTDFYCAPHGQIFTAICELFRYEGAVDLLLMADYLKGVNQLDEVGGVVYLAQVSSSVATAANIKHHARIIKKHALARSLLVFASKLTEKAYQDEPLDTSAWALGQCLDLTQEHEARRAYGMPEIMSEVDAKLKEAMRTRRRWAGLDTGFGPLNDLLNGLCVHEMTICGASPKVGKTRLAMQIARCIAVSGQGKVLIYSLEMNRVQLGEYWGCVVAGLDLTRFRRGWLDDSEYRRYQEARAEIDQWPIIVDDQAGLTIPELYASSERHFARHSDIKLVIIDYLQLMTGPERDETPKFDNICRGLKDYKKRYPVHLWTLSQLSREVSTRVDRRPQTSDLRNTGMIEANADNIVLIYRPGLYDHLVKKEGNRVELMCPILRNNAPGTAHLEWNPTTAQFVNPGALLG